MLNDAICALYAGCGGKLCQFVQRLFHRPLAILRHKGQSDANQDGAFGGASQQTAHWLLLPLFVCTWAMLFCHTVYSFKTRTYATYAVFVCNLFIGVECRCEVVAGKGCVQKIVVSEVSTATQFRTITPFLHPAP